MLISIIVPTKNEEDNIRKVLDSLVIQEKPIEIIVIDAESTDQTQEIVKEYCKKYPFVKLFSKKGKRGKSMNYAIKMAKGDVVSFIGADDKAHKEWIKYNRKGFSEGHDIVVGKCESIGNKKFELDRVKLFYKGFDISVPGTNTAYKREILLELNGFDPNFVTAEDIELNLRAVDSGYKIYYQDKAVVYRCLRENMIDFLSQSFWNGYGRKQLTLKHGKLWKNYSAQQTFKTQFTLYGIIRLSFGLLGYIVSKIQKGIPKN